jgi:hypothetical protein
VGVSRSSGDVGKRSTEDEVSLESRDYESRSAGVSCKSRDDVKKRRSIYDGTTRVRVSCKSRDYERKKRRRIERERGWRREKRRGREDD